ncbi:hypothetical protein pEaSNUABM49_00046 [Erwinia phage pEa_SNUABM_49]|nr:hypothetical protein pEaSNUABM49_00046 [Erwinia phage pEa_SNUABM_49]
MESMIVLKDFYEKFAAPIADAGLLSTAKNTKTLEWGGRVKGLRYTFTSTDSYTSVKLVDETDYTFALDAVCYREQNGAINATRTFFTSPTWTEIYTGTGFSTTKINVCHRDESEFRRDMNYPILEEEYFQNSTMIELEEESFYQYFMGFEPAAIELCLKFSHVDNGVELARTVLNDNTLINNILMQLNILIMTYKRQK